MKILAVNTSDENLSVALKMDDRLMSKQAYTLREHNKAILGVIHNFLVTSEIQPNQLDAIAFGEGPGSFTGLRIAAGVAQGIAFGANIPVVPVSCMAAVAQSRQQNKVIVVIEAKGGRVFWAKYMKDENGIAQLQGEETLSVISDFHTAGRDWWGAGSGWDACAEELRAHLGGSVNGWTPGIVPDAGEIAVLGEYYLAKGLGKEPSYAIPKYLYPYSPG